MGYTIVAIWCENMLGYLSANVICSEKRTVFRERSSRKAVCYKEPIMSKDKYPSIFSSQMATIVFIILQIAVLKIGEYSRIFPSFSWGIFGHVTRLGQSRISKKIWWIIIHHMAGFLTPVVEKHSRRYLKTGVQALEENNISCNAYYFE